MMDRQFARAVRAYLSLAEHRTSGDAEQERATATKTAGPPGAAVGGQGPEDGERGEGRRGAEGTQYAHVFRMIEQHSLFDTVQVWKDDTKYKELLL